MVSLLAFSVVSPLRASAFVVDFEAFPDGYILGPTDLGNGITVSVVAEHGEGDDSDSDPDLEPVAPVVFDSDCSSKKCKKEEKDLRTPGTGLGNNVAQNNILILDQDPKDTNPADGIADGAHRNPDPGTLTLTFSSPLKLESLRAINVTSHASGSRLEIHLTAGGTQVVPFALLDKNSAQTIVVPNPQLADSVDIVLTGEIGIDDLSFGLACGDGVLDPGEQCDDGNTSDGDCCTSSCTVVAAGTACDDGDACTPADTCDGAGACMGGGSTCGDGVLDAACGEQCDDGNTSDGDCCDGSCRFEIAAMACPDDGNICTDDVCDGAGVCLHVNNQAPCDDGDACTVGDSCLLGTCNSGSSISCDDGNPCTDDSCDAVTGCLHVDNAAPCDDGNACTTGDTCSAGTCQPGPPLVCDDGNACTDDTCDVQSGCVFTNNTAPCDDGDACTVGDSCTNGQCVSGSPLVCDDGNQCTDDTCDAQSGCVFTNNTGTCDNGNPFDDPDVCSGGSCTGQGGCQGNNANCDDGNPCTDDLCLPSGECQHTNNTAPCDDGDACTTGDQCGAGTCQPGSPLVCNDGNACTDDTCDTQSGCVYTNNTAPCDDGNACTTGDTCSAGTCQPGPPLTCDDGNVCTDDTCDTQSGCVYTNNTAPCDDANACTTGDTCSAGTCQPGSPLTCDDGNVCTDDTCDMQSGCVFTNNTAPCDDGNACTTGDQCSAGSCAGGPPLTCDDGNVCTDDTCNPASGCVFTNNTSGCDNGNPFDDPDVCSAGVCTGQGGCQGNDANCDDNNPCTDDVCLTSGACQHTNNTAPCDDGNACTTADTCSGGTCQGGPPPNCDDGNACTDDTCDIQSGCVFTNNTAPCDDGNACTTGDTCSAGTCQPGSPLTCDDGNVCTDDTCDIQSGCVFTPNTAPCDDGNACTTGDQCSAGSCVGGPPLTCDDGNACTDDTCDTQSGCVFTNNTAPCDDGNACTTGDHCGAGTCQPGSPLTCDDGNACTDDTCDTQSGCVYTNNTAPCDDGSACTTGDICLNGTCVSGSPIVCDDGNPCTDDTCDTQSGCVYTNNTAPCDDGNVCTDGDTCSGGSCIGGPPLSCDDGNVCTDDNCDSLSGCFYSPNSGPCDDGLFCNGPDVCASGVCTPTGDPCAGGAACNSTCNEATDTCFDPAGTPCDDGDVCTPADSCDGAGQCVGGGTTCGDGIVQGACGEECDPPGMPLCDAQCVRPRNCGDGVVDAGEECDDGNTIAGDGCTDCVIDAVDIVCFEGEQAAPARGAKRIAFVSHADYTGENPDGNAEIFLFHRRDFAKLVKKGTAPADALHVPGIVEQITDTVSLVPGEDNIQEQPTTNASARFIAFVSNGDLEVQGEKIVASLTGAGNPDGNKEVYHFDRKKLILTQVTHTVNPVSGPEIDNLHPNLRSLKANLLVFDSPANLMPDHCVGGSNDLDLCSSNSDCAGVICGDDQLCPLADAACGNPNGNREIFEWLRFSRNGVQLRQLTEAPSGISFVGPSINFQTRAVAISSTGDLLRNKPPQSAGSREIYRIIKKAENIEQITQLTSSDYVSESPSQSRKRLITFASDADLVPGENTDGNKEIFLWTDRTGPSGDYTQVTHTTGCSNTRPSIGAQGRFIAFESTCHLAGSINPGQSVYVYDIRRNGFLNNLRLRGPGGSYDASAPTVTRRVRIITFEIDPQSSQHNQLCVFNARKEVFEGPISSP